MKHTKQHGILLAACMLAASCIAPFSVLAEQLPGCLPWGDADCSGKVDVADAVLVARFCAEDALATITDTGRANADVNGDRNLDSADMQEILEYIAKKRTAFSGAAAQQPAEKLTKTENLMDGLTRSAQSGKQADDVFRVSQYDLTASLLKEVSKKEEPGNNVMISPFSFSQALSMAANGAKGNTLDELTKLLGGDLSMDDLNQYYCSYAGNLPQSEKAKLDIANAIWFIDDDNKIKVPQNYLQTTKDYFDSDVFRSPFNQQTVNDINGWVKEKTHDMIPELIDSLDPASVMMLVNAVYFDAEWKKPYEDFQVHDRWFFLSEGAEYQADYEELGPYPPDAFPWSWPGVWDGSPYDEPSGTDVSEQQPDAPSQPAESENGKAVRVKLMSSQESIYLENDCMTGFMRPYAGEGYSFVGLLPKENSSVQECIANMTGESLKELLASKELCDVTAAIPKFSSDYSVDLIPVMAALGVKDAFDSSAADFTGLNEIPPTWINKVLQKTRIEVDEKGTRAAAATGIGMGGGAMFKTKDVILDHPFIYMIVDNETELPLFIGYMMKPEWQE